MGTSAGRAAPDRAARFVIGAALFLACGAVPGGVLPGESSTPSNLQVWGRGEGLPVNAVLSLAQSRTGDIWIGTANGLVRFDGESFRTIDRRTSPTLKHDDIEALAEDESGALWIGTLGGLNVLRAGVLTSYRLDENEPCILSLFAHRGIVWVGTERGLYRIDPAHASTVGLIRSGRVRAIAATADGSILVGTEEGLRRLVPGGLFPYGGPAGALGRILSILPEADGSLWLGTSHGVFSLSRGIATRAEIGGRPTVIRTILRTRAGTVWVGAREGLFRIENGRPRLASPSLANEVVPALLEDRDGDLWIATVSSGLVRIGQDPVLTVDFGNLLPDQSVWALEADSRGRIWFGTAKGRFGLVVPGSGTLNVVRQLDAPITAIASEPGAETLLVSTFGRGAFRYDPERETWKSAGLPDDLVVLALSRAARGGMWAGTIGGVRHLGAGKVEELNAARGLPSNIVTSVHEDRSGRLWIGFSERGLAEWKDGALRLWTVREGLAHNSVIAIAEGADGETWVATAGGLTRIRDGVAQSAPPWLVGQIVESVIDDARGHLWLGTGRGILRIAKSAMDSGRGAPAAGDILELGHSAGMRSAACSTGNASVVRTPDGRIWFGTQSGLARVDPDHLTIPAVAPAVRIEELIRDGKTLRPRPAWSVPSGPGALAIGYTAPSFRAAENLRFEYRMAGIDRDWVRAGNRRTAYYTNLPPGRYDFEVRVREGDGPPSGATARQRIVVEPRWFQTAWFAGGVAAAVAGILLLAHRFRVNHVSEELRLKSALERAQLSALREQLRPHFLFNTLNTVLPLIRHAPDAAETMIVELSDLLRASLRTEPSQLVPLEEEMRTVRQYFRIAGLRFRERFSLSVQIAPEVEQALVPSFLLQPIAENAIRHGVEKSSGRVDVRLAAWAAGSSLRIEMSNDAAATAAATAADRQAGSPPEPSAGIGLDNTRRRLSWLFGESARLELVVRERGARTTIVMPLLFAPATPDRAEQPESLRESAGGG